MDTGTVGFKNDKQCFIVKDWKRNKDILKRLEKTRKEKKVDLQKELEDRQTLEIAHRKKLVAQMKADEKDAAKKAAEMKDMKSYSSLFKEGNMKANDEWGENYGGTVDECRAME